MRSRRSIRCLFTAAALVPITLPAYADAENVDLGYRIYLGGLSAISAQFSFERIGDQYSSVTSLQTVGVLNWFYTWRMSAFARGSFVNKSVMPARAGQSHKWRDRGWLIDLEFKNGLAEIERVASNWQSDYTRRLPPEWRANVFDLNSGIFALLFKVERNSNSNCDAKSSVFDGRKRYDLILEHIGTEQLSPSRKSVYSGKSLRCRLWVDEKMGRKIDPNLGWKKRGRGAQVWIANVLPSGPPVPVRLEMGTRFGTIVAHLGRVTYLLNGVQKTMTAPGHN